MLAEWRANYQPSSLIESQDLYKTRPGPYLYLETGSEEMSYFALFPQFVKQLSDLQVPTDSYEWVTSTGGHTFDENRALGALKYALEKMEDISTSTKNYAPEFNYSVHPNPVSHDEITVSFDSPSIQGNAVLIVMDMLGRTVKSIGPDAIKGLSTIKVNVSDLTQGIYFFQLKIDTKQAIQKVIIR